MKKVLSVALTCSMALSLVIRGDGGKPTGAPTTAAAGDTTTVAAADATAADTAVAPEADAEVANKGKPLVWFSHQPSNSATGQLGMVVLNFSKDAYYVGFDANQGAELQGTMVKDYIEKNTDSIDRNGDGIIGCILATDDIRHDGSITHIRDIREALDTTVEKDGNVDSDPVGINADGTTMVVRDDSIEVGGKIYVVRELASQEMKNFTGVTRDTATAGNAIGTQSPSFGGQTDVITSNNDGMGMPMFNTWSKGSKAPTFGYGANSDVVVAVAEGHGGTISQYADVQAYLTLRALHNTLSGADTDTSIGTADGVGNALSSDVYVCRIGKRSYYVLDVAVTAENYTDFIDSTVVYAPVSNQLNEVSHATKNIWLNIHNPTNNFLGSTYQPLLQKYDKFLNLKADYIGDGGQTESNIIDRLGGPSRYDAFATNMVKTDNAASYTFLLEW